MSINSFATRDQLGLLVVDVQEKLFPYINRAEEILKTIQTTIQLAKLFNLPIIVTEQYPEGLGSTLLTLKDLLPGQRIFSKTTFSGGVDSLVLHEIKNLNIKEWLIVGIETHICVLQTAKDLLLRGNKVIILHDATSSRTAFNFAIGIEELRDYGARITSFESLFYELIRNSKDPLFKEMLSYIKQL